MISSLPSLQTIPGTNLAKQGAIRVGVGGKGPADLPRVAKAGKPAKQRDVFLFMISGAKERAPAAARGLIERLAEKGTT